MSLAGTVYEWAFSPLEESKIFPNSEDSPCMVASDEETASSLDELSVASTSCSSALSTEVSPKKSVSWSTIEIREYSVCLGDHPFCQDGLPIQLDWEYVEGTKLDMESLGSIGYRHSHYRFPQRMSYEVRRQRLLEMSGKTDEELRGDEIALAVRQLQEAWAESSIDDSMLLGTDDVDFRFE